MLKFLRFPILATFSCLISCNPITDTGPKIIKINESDFINIPLEQVLSVSDFTPLEFTPESALAESAMFLDCTTGYFLMDNYKKGCLPVRSSRPVYPDNRSARERTRGIR